MSLCGARLAVTLLVFGLLIGLALAVTAPEGCKADENPVCVWGGATYSNECMALQAGAEIAHAGACGEGGCPEDWNPICGVNGQTYGNACDARRNGIRPACKGECPCLAFGGEPDIGGELEPEMEPWLGGEEETGYLVCFSEGMEVRKNCDVDLVETVCGGDGASHVNSCVAFVEDAFVACEGGCPCLADCPQEISAVCGSDGETYANECFALAAGATVACEGRCRGFVSDGGETAPFAGPIDSVPLEDGDYVFEEIDYYAVPTITFADYDFEALKEGLVARGYGESGADQFIEKIRPAILAAQEAEAAGDRGIAGAIFDAINYLIDWLFGLPASLISFFGGGVVE